MKKIKDQDCICCRGSDVNPGYCTESEYNECREANGHTMRGLFTSNWIYEAGKSMA